MRVCNKYQFFPFQNMKKIDVSRILESVKINIILYKIYKLISINIRININLNMSNSLISRPAPNCHIITISRAYMGPNDTSPRPNAFLSSISIHQFSVTQNDKNRIHWLVVSLSPHIFDSVISHVFTPAIP